MKRILIATDGSESAFEALEQGFAIAADVCAAVTVLYVSDASTEKARHARGVISGAKHRADAFELDVEYEVREGDPVEEILERARARDADLLVVGSRGLGAVSSLTLGSVSTAIVHQADRPVLVTKTPVTATAVV